MELAVRWTVVMHRGVPTPGILYSKIAPQLSPRTLGVETPTGRTACLQVLRDFVKFHETYQKSEAQETFRKFGQILKFWDFTQKPTFGQWDELL